MMKKRSIAALLLMSMLTSLVACETEAESEESSHLQEEETTAEEGYTYDFCTDFSGQSIHILNYTNMFEGHAKLTVDIQNGEVLNDAQYLSTVTLEDKMGIELVETNLEYSSYQSTVRSVLAAADETYDIIYFDESDMYPIAKDGYLVNLLSLDNLSLHEDWWLHEYNDLCVLNDTLYSAEGYANLLVVDFMNIMLYNEDLGELLQLDTPYQLVKDGAWTLDKFAEYMKTGATLNKGSDTPDSDNIWNFDQPGNGAAMTGMLVSAGELFLEAVDGKLTFTGGSERFFNVCDRLAQIMTENKPYMFNKERYGVGEVFRTNQALFSYGEINSTSVLREVDFSFGVLPNPKYDENQERYYCCKSWPASGAAIPTCLSNPERSAAVADAMNYLAYTLVWPSYRGLVLEQKNLRNPESIEMLDIILRSSTPLLKNVYQIGASLISTISEKIMNGDANIASAIAKNRSSIETLMDKVNTAANGE